MNISKRMIEPSQPLDADAAADADASVAALLAMICCNFSSVLTASRAALPAFST